MRRNIYGLISSFSILVLFSCSEQTSPIFEGEFLQMETNCPSRNTYLRINDGVGESSQMFVKLAGAQRSNPVNFTFEIDPESTAIENLHYTIEGTSASIPANASSVELPITILDDNINAGELLTLNLNLVSSDLDLNPNYSNACYEINVTCPIDGKYLGDYAVSYVDAQFLFGPATFGEEGTIVTLSEVAGTTSKRSFDFVYLESGAFGNAAQAFTFDLNCNNVLVDPDQILDLSCDGSDITAGPATDVSLYDEVDDSVLEITFLEFVQDGGCGVTPPVRQVVSLIKQ